MSTPVPSTTDDPDDRLACALKYAAAGFKVIPVRRDPSGARDKHPLTEHGAHDSTLDPEQIRRWFQKWRNANVALTLEDLVVVDEDPRNGGDVGSLPNQLPNTCIARTGGGGTHRLYRARNGARYPKQLCQGIDLKTGPGAYIVVEPSIHANGNKYCWLDETEPWDVKPAQAPQWLEQQSAAPAAPASDGDRKIAQGKRHDHLASLAGTMRARAMSPQAIEAGLLADNVARCEPPLSEAEVRRIAQDIGSKPAGGPKPKAPPDAGHEATPPHKVSDLMQQAFPALVWILAGLIPEGTILLAGKPKSGKSWFVLDLLLAAVLAIEFLQRQVTRCSALYLALEDTPRRLQARLRTLMRDYEHRGADLARFEYHTDWARGAMGALLLDEYLAARPDCKIVGIDVLAKIRPITDGKRSASAYEVDYEAIAPWKTIADKHRVTLLIVHHTRKAAADDVFDEVSGTLGINGVVDEIVILRRAVGDKNRATLHFRGRDLPEDHELGLELRDGWWRYIGTAAQVDANEARRKVLEVLADAERPMGVTEILMAAGKRSRPAMSRLLSHMVAARLIVRDGKKYTQAPD